MPVIAVKPILLRDCVLDIKLVGAGTADSYQNHVSRVRLVPTTSVIRWRGLAPAAKYSAQTDPDWAAELAFVQDWETANSLAAYLLANTGKEAELTFRPRGGTTPGHKVTAILTAPPIGGDVDTVLIGEVSLGVIGVPVAVA